MNKKDNKLIINYIQARIANLRQRGYGYIYDKVLEGKMYLEIPDSNLNFSDIERYKQIANQKGITLRFKPE